MRNEVNTLRKQGLLFAYKRVVNGLIGGLLTELKAYNVIVY